MRAEAAAALAARFPPRIVPDRWEATTWDRGTVTARLLVPPFATGVQANINRRRRGLIRFLDWRGNPPGDSRHNGWLASGSAVRRRLTIPRPLAPRLPRARPPPA